MRKTKVRGRMAVESGAVVEGRGVYLGPWEAAPGHSVHAYAADDFLRDGAGKPLTLSFNDAVIELARRNQAWVAGNGTEAALREDRQGKQRLRRKVRIASKRVAGRQHLCRPECREPSARRGSSAISRS